jgi:peroxiredoxin
VDDYDVLMTLNDAFVMDAWGKSQGATGKIRMLADTSGEFTKVLCFLCVVYGFHALCTLYRLLILVLKVLPSVDSDLKGVYSAACTDY